MASFLSSCINKECHGALLPGHQSWMAPYFFPIYMWTWPLQKMLFSSWNFETKWDVIMLDSWKTLRAFVWTWSIHCMSIPPAAPWDAVHLRVPLAELMGWRNRMLSDLAVSDSMTYDSLVFSTAACTFSSCSEDKTKISKTSSSAASQRWFVLRRWTYQGDLDDESFISDGRPLPDEPVLNKCDQFGGVKRRLEALWNFARPFHNVHNLKMRSCTSSLGVQFNVFLVAKGIAD